MADEKNVFKILVATDIHLGYAEEDPVRCRDSINTFEEILQISQEQKVDFILLGGDLFHENRPSQWILHECVRLLRQYCLSSKAVNFDFLSDASINFAHSRFPHPNYQDENLNVGTPVFTINGNHDDFVGRNLCVLDLLHETGLVNYFGKYSSVEQITISPLLLRKNGTQLALFGLGSVRDERLHRMFLNNKVKFLTLADKSAACQEWFNLLVLHQNRVKHGATNYIPEKMLPDFFDLVIWGHEHPCFIDPTPSAENEFYVVQPGSSVATALSEGEAGDKYVGLLKIKGKDFTVDKIKLNTVRQFYFEHVNMADTKIVPNMSDTLAKLEAFCYQKVDDLRRRAVREHSGSNRQPKEPLIRLSIDLWVGYNESFNVTRFGQQFIDQVANHKDIVLFHRHRDLVKNRNAGVDTDVVNRLSKTLSSRVEDYIVKYFANVSEDQQLTVLTEKGLAEALRHFVDKDEKDSIKVLYKHQVERCRARLHKEQFEHLDEENAEKILKQIHDLRVQKDKGALEEDQQDIDQALHEASILRSKVSRSSSQMDDEEHNQSSLVDDFEDGGGDVLMDDDDAEDDDEDGGDVFTRATTPRQPVKRARVSGTGVRRGRAASRASSNGTPGSGRGRPPGRGRGRRGTRKAAASIADFWP